MVVEKYDALGLPSNERYVDKATGLIFKNPNYYFCFLIFISIIMLLLSPHTVIHQGSEDLDHGVQGGREFSDYDTSFLDLQYFEPPEETFESKEQLTENQFKSRPRSTEAQCSGFKDNERFDCFPEKSVTEEACKSRGCCWAPVNSSSKGELGVPFCFYPSKFRSYKFLNVSLTDLGATAFLENVVNSTYPDNVPLIKIDFNYLDENILQVKIYDPKHTRFESPLPKIQLTGRQAAKNTSYLVNIDKDKLGFNVIRKSNNQSIFNAEDIGGFIFADQLLQLSAQLPSRHIYGLGQQRNEFLLDTNWRLITLFNRDQEPTDRTNLYGMHPFYLAVEDGGLAHGVFLHNTNAMDIILQPAPAITYRTIGGILDFYFFLGPTPGDVISQYTELIGRPFLPPYWSLGFHLCRFGYKTLNDTKEVWNRTRNAGIPLDTQWNDIDYMDRRNDFTYDPITYKGLPQFVDLLHKEGMHYMIITDPGVSAGETPGTYPPYDEGLKEGVFIMDPTEDKPFLTKVWNYKYTVLPDFFNPKTDAYWTNQIKHLHEKFAFDGLWIDMNEPSTEKDGGIQGCPSSKLENPPYLPRVEGGKLCSRTACMTARHYGALHYDVHSIYGTQEGILTVRFPKDEKTYSLHSQFLWGSGLLIAPLLSEEKAYATAYLPTGRWYDFYSSKPIDSKGSTYLLNTPNDSIPLLLRGGRILPTQRPNTTTTASRLNPMGLLVSLCEHNMAHGDLYWDDGDSYDFENGSYNYITFKATAVNISSTVEQWRFKTSLMLGEVKVLGVTANVNKVLVNGHPANFTYKPDVKFLDVVDLSVDLSQPFTIAWS